ncbi:MAG TPA: aldo/keto reductase [Chitinophagaceae bacterium]|nr:aldo/keto reductase [Chitinophagaceae bacterium]
MLQRAISSTNELIPAIGLGTWKVFDVDPAQEHPELLQVLHQFHKAGATVIDSSPMYGNAEEITGQLTQASGIADKFFYATKVWIQGRQEGIRQMEASMRKMQRSTVELMQIHNLVDWQIHLETLREWKAAGKIKYIGITHYTDSMHAELEKIISTEPIDFVQFNYSIHARAAEKRLLPAAAEHGVATLINRPFGEGALFSKVRGKQLPEWVKEYNIHSWAQLFLKFILSHPAVTCVIPATSKVSNAIDNLQAGQGEMPDAGARQKLAALF